MTDTLQVTGGELVRRIKRTAGKRNVQVLWVRERGKGSHGTLYYGGRLAVLPNLKRELKPGTLHGILAQLGLRPRDIR